MATNDYTWYLENDLREYGGKWVAIKKRKVVAADEDLDVLIKEVTKKYKLSEVSLASIPNPNMALIY